MRATGISLLELMVALLVLAVVAAALSFSFRSDAAHKLDAAGAELAAALRFARSEAIRTGEPYGARIGSAEDRVRVYRLVTTSTPYVEEFQVLHPVDKKLYDVRLGDTSSTSGVEVSSSDFKFGGSGTSHETVTFEASGMPISPVDLAPMDTGSANLQYGSASRSVVVAPMTGRVEIQ